MFHSPAARFLLAIAVTCVVLPAAYAQDFCLELARRGLFDTYAGKTFYSSYDESRTAYCRKYREASSENTGLFAAYGDINLDFTNSETKQKAELLCNNTYNLAALLSSAETRAQVFSDNAVKVVQACVNATGVRFSGSFPSSDRYILDVFYTSPPGVTSFPSFTGPINVTGGVKCRGPLTDVKKDTQLNNSAVGVECERSASSTSEDRRGPYGPYRLEKGGAVTVFTSAGLYSVEFPPKVVGPACAPQTTELSPKTLSGLCVGCLGADYGPVVTDTINASNSGNGMVRVLEYEVDLPSCGDYRLGFRYASGDSRPVKLIVDGVTRNTAALGRVTGTFAFAGQQEPVVPEVVLPLAAGHHVIRLERQGPFPHISSARLYPY